MEGYGTIFDFKGKTIDRSVYDFDFDGADLKLLIQDTSASKAFLEISYEWVVHFVFESKESMAAVPNYHSEALIEFSASDYISTRQHRFGDFFTSDVRHFALYLLDVGDLHVISRNVTVTRK